MNRSDRVVNPRKVGLVSVPGEESEKNGKIEKRDHEKHDTGSWRDFDRR